MRSAAMRAGGVGGMLIVALGIAVRTSGQQATVTPSAAPAATAPGVRALAIANKTWTGDLDRLLDRRMIRVLVPYSRTLYFNDRGRERGLTADLVREFERWLNTKRKTGRRPVTVYLVPTTRDKLLSKVADGLGDIAAGNLTLTASREATVDFVVQPGRNPREVIVTGAGAVALRSLDELAGRTVHVRPSSSYYENLQALDAAGRAAGRSAIELRSVPDALEDEDMMEMANAGLIDYLVVDDWKAHSWAQILPAIRVRDDLVVHDGGRIGWAIRKGSPQLAAALAEFFATSHKTASYDYRLVQVIRRVKQMKNNTASADWKRFESTLALFRRYGEQYDFDPLMLAAQGYQESQLDQSARSHVGAIGIMQIMPATGAQMKVGDIHKAEANIHAGAKYMDHLMENYFADAHFSAGNRPLFAFASYNAGPGTISRMRREAAKRGLDPDKWFNNVELVVAEKVGIETTTYVRNIYKYYVSYKLTLEAEEASKKARVMMKASSAG